MSAKAGWYPDPGGGQDLFRFWDGKAWSAATSPNPGAMPPPQGLGPSQPTQLEQLGGQHFGDSGYGPAYGQTGQAGYGQTGYGQTSYGQAGYGPGAPGSTGGAYANYQQIQKKRSPIGWWIAGAALVVVIVVVAVIAIRAVTGGTGTSGLPGGQPSPDVCPAESSASPEPNNQSNDGRVHGGPVSYPELGSPFGPPEPGGGTMPKVPFGSDVMAQTYTVEQNYNGQGGNWVASVMVGQLQAGDGFFTPEQGSQIVVKCILGRFYGDSPVTSNVKVNKATTIDGHEAWLTESQLSFDIPGLTTKGELLIVAIVSAGATSGIYYASIPDTVPELVQPARDALADLKVDG